jgi:hypothetical protein
LKLVWDLASEGHDRTITLDEGGGIQVLVIRGILVSRSDAGGFCQYAELGEECLYLDLHDDETDDVHPDRGVCQPTDALQASDVANDGTEDGEDEDADDVADVLVRELADERARSEGEHGNGHKLLDGLGDIDEVARLGAIDTEEGVTVADHGETSRVKAQEDLPEDPTRVPSSDTEDKIETGGQAVTSRGVNVSKPC